MTIRLYNTRFKKKKKIKFVNCMLFLKNNFVSDCDLKSFKKFITEPSLYFIIDLSLASFYYWASKKKNNYRYQEISVCIKHTSVDLVLSVCEFWHCFSAIHVTRVKVELNQRERDFRHVANGFFASLTIIDKWNGKMTDILSGWFHLKAETGLPNLQLNL